jgi:hypothetical protein
VREREIAAVAAYLAEHPFASDTELAEARAAERAKEAAKRVPYYDLTISAAKSVSVLHASLKVAAKQARDDGNDETADALDAEADGIEADLVAAARLAVEQLEREACYTRTGHHSATTGEWRDGNGLTAALFTHHISRDGDPQLHVHVAIANLVQRADEADGKWRSLDGKQLYAMKLSVAAAADRALESRLIRGAGLRRQRPRLPGTHHGHGAPARHRIALPPVPLRRHDPWPRVQRGSVVRVGPGHHPRVHRHGARAEDAGETRAVANAVPREPGS